MPSIALPVSLRGQLLSGSKASPLAQFATWFLKSGTWDLEGQWVDAASWVQNWFLATGTINVYGVWADSEAWT